MEGDASGRRARYAFLDAVTSDLTFVARGATLGEAFRSASEALLAATLEDPGRLEARERVHVELEEESPELLLLRFLDELIFQRDARGLLLRAERVEIERRPEGTLRLDAELVGERIDPARHSFATEIKAATAHGLRVERREGGWELQVTVDV